jgi:hypothetical protein
MTQFKIRKYLLVFFLSFASIYLYASSKNDWNYKHKKQEIFSKFHFTPFFSYGFMPSKKFEKFDYIVLSEGYKPTHRYGFNLTYFINKKWSISTGMFEQRLYVNVGYKLINNIEGFHFFATEIPPKIRMVKLGQVLGIPLTANYYLPVNFKNTFQFSLGINIAYNSGSQFYSTDYINKLDPVSNQVIDVYILEEIYFNHYDKVTVDPYFSVSWLRTLKNNKLIKIGLSSSLALMKYTEGYYNLMVNTPYEVGGEYRPNYNTVMLELGYVLTGVKRNKKKPNFLIDEH